jgi:hypothetical protein
MSPIKRLKVKRLMVGIKQLFNLAIANLQQFPGKEQTAVI